MLNPQCLLCLVFFDKSQVWSFNAQLTQGHVMIGSKTLKMGQIDYFLLMLWDEGTKHLSHLSSNGGSRHTKRCWSEASSRLSTSWFQNHPTGLLLLLFTFQSPQSHCAETESYTWLETIRLLIPFSVEKWQESGKWARIDSSSTVILDLASLTMSARPW